MRTALEIVLYSPALPMPFSSARHFVLSLSRNVAFFKSWLIHVHVCDSDVILIYKSAGAAFTFLSPVYKIYEYSSFDV